MAKIKIIIVGKEKPIESDENLVSINYNKVIEILKNLNIITRKNQIEFIRFINEDESWELLSPKTPEIILDCEETFQLMVKLIKKEIPDQNIESIINKAKKICSSIDKEISELKEPQFLKNSSSNLQNLNITLKQSSSFGLSEIALSEQSIYYQDNKNADIIILTANPLVYIDDNSDPKELRTMNDFNSITYSIYRVVSNTIYQVVTKSSLPVVSQFLTLTKNTLKYALSKRPKILHLLCKSTYEVDNNDQKLYSPILLFENEKCELEKVTKKSLSKILHAYKDNVKDISLFISTPLCEDVFNMINSIQSIKFRNLLVQPTTIANISFLEEFNRELYIKILDKQPLKQAFYSAKSVNISGNQFCCCYHSHKDECILRKNLSNELFRCDEKPLLPENSQENNNDNNTTTKNIRDKLKEEYPHLYHLRYKCECKSQNKIDDKNKKNSKNDKNINLDNFCLHERSDCENRINIIFNKRRRNNICCCISDNDKVPGRHNLDDIFKKYFKEEDKDIFADYEKEDYKKCIVIDSDKLPNYGKMKFKVGLNKVFYNVFEFITSNKYKILNFYGNQNNAVEIENIIITLIEFIKERYFYFLKDNQQYYFNNNNKNPNSDLGLSKCETTEKFSEKNINKTKYQLSKANSNKSLELEPNSQKSAKLLHYDPNYIRPLPSFIILEKEISNSDISKFQVKQNEIYIINDFKNQGWIKKILAIKDKLETSFIIFSLEEIKEKEKENEVINNICFNTLDEFDRMILYQNKKIENKKDDFEELLKDKRLHITDEEIIETQKLIEDESEKDEMYFLILYLFECVNSGLFKFEFERLFPDKLQCAQESRDFYEDKNVVIKETKRDNEGGKGKTYKVFIKYIKNKIAYSKMIKHIKIPEHIKYNVLQRLFLFYAKKFRFLLNSLKNIDFSEKSEKGYEPDNILLSFSAIQIIGIWLPLNDKNKFDEIEDAEIYNWKGYFNHLNRNLKDILLESNLNFCHNNKDVWKNIREYLEDISITLPTLYKVFSNREIEESISSFKNFFRKFEFSKEAKLRFELFEKMQSDYNTNNKEKIKKDLELIEKGFSEINNKEGQLETLYARIISNDKEEIIANLRSTYDNKIEKILNEMKKDDKNKMFVDLFDSKIKYKLIECKIDKKRIDIIDDYKKIIKIFDQYNLQLYVINTFLLLHYYYFKALNNNDNIKNVDALKYEHLLYFNCAYMYAKDDKHITYVKLKAKDIESLSEALSVGKFKEKYENFQKKIKEIYKECGLNTNKVERNTLNYYFYEDLLKK